jgi:hypothetical protein
MFLQISVLEGVYITHIHVLHNNELLEASLMYLYVIFSC